MARPRPKLGQKLRASATAAATVALVLPAILALRGFGWLERMELAAYDHTVRQRAEGPPVGDRVAVIEVSEEDIRALGQWPISDAVLADVVEALNRYGARAMGFDLYRDMPVAPGTDRLERVLRESPRAIFITKIPDERSSGVLPPPALAGTGQVAFNNFVVDLDGFVRRGLLFMEGPRGATELSFALVLASLHLAVEGIGVMPVDGRPDLVRIGDTVIPQLLEHPGPYRSADTGGYQFLADFRRAPHRFPTIRLMELLEGDVDPGFFEDRIAVLGVTADSSPDLFYVAFEREQSTEIFGVALHAQLASSLIRYGHGEASPIQVLPAWVEMLAIVVCGVLAALLAVWSSSLGRFVLSSGVAVVGLYGIGLFAIGQDWLLPIIPTGLAWLASGTVVTVYLAGRVRAERAELMQLFSAHVAKEVAEEVWEHRDEFMAGGRPEPRRLTATVLFVDMKGYTGKADLLDPGDLMLWLNDYLDLLAQDILSAGGLIDDYFGDGILACFGLPVPRTTEEEIRQDAISAVSCARAMETSVERLNEKWVAKGYPRIGIRVGLCTGEMVAGTIGSAERLKYSIVGDVVVTAQRLESLDDTDHDFEKEPIRILVSDQTRAHLGDVEAAPIGSFVLKGRTEPVPVYRIMGTLGEQR
jgi:adenylate cyclase